jgi:hypothetical protein
MEEQKITYTQPWETTVKIEDKVNAKGELVPEVKVAITRKLSDNVNLIESLEGDIELVKRKARETLLALRKLESL